ncbi:MAG: hypothetical protein IJZ34_15610 [Lachnospiraceae bacterium]|nr:hypothetical protein [Lachnospiraceae bacterium]
MKTTNYDIKKAAEVAQFRFGIIAPVIQDLYPDASRTAYYKRVADSPFTLPDGSVVEYNYMIVDCSEDDLVVNDLALLLATHSQDICHEVVDQTWISTGITMDGSKSGIVDDAAGSPGAVKLVDDVF